MLVLENISNSIESFLYWLSWKIGGAIGQDLRLWVVDRMFKKLSKDHPNVKFYGVKI